MTEWNSQLLVLDHRLLHRCALYFRFKIHIVPPPYSGISSLPTQKHHRIILIGRDLQSSSSPTPCSTENQMSRGNTGKKSILTETTSLRSPHKKRPWSDLISHLEKCQQPTGNLTLPAGYGAASAQEGLEATDLFLWSVRRPTRTQLLSTHQPSRSPRPKNPISYTAVIREYLGSECIK